MWGASFAGALGTANYNSHTLFNLAYCTPNCMEAGYVLSVVLGSSTASSINYYLLTYFLEKYKTNWLIQNQGRYYVENKVFRRVPILAKVKDNLPEGLAFISSSFFSKSGVSILARVVIVRTISHVILFIFNKVVKAIINFVITSMKKTSRKVFQEKSKNEKTTIDSLDVYHALVNYSISFS